MKLFVPPLPLAIVVTASSGNLLRFLHVNTVGALQTPLTDFGHFEQVYSFCVY